MLLSLLVALLFTCVSGARRNTYQHAPKTCPDGEPIIESGLTPFDADLITTIHNQFRRDLLMGRIANQPKPLYMHLIAWDQRLQALAAEAGSKCDIQVNAPQDGRWPQIGLNIRMQMAALKLRPNWPETLSNWFEQSKNFQFPGGTSPDQERMTLNYKQMVWANTSFVGCNFQIFVSQRLPKFPYAHVYLCVYGPGGNIAGEPPYDVVDDYMQQQPNNMPNLQQRFLGDEKTKSKKHGGSSKHHSKTSSASTARPPIGGKQLQLRALIDGNSTETESKPAEDLGFFETT